MYLLKLFKSHQPFVLVLIPIVAFLPWINAFLHPDQIQTAGTSMLPVYKIISIALNKYGLVSLCVAFLLVLLQGFLLIRFNNKYILIEGRTYLPALFFVIIAGSFAELRVLHPVMFANIFFILALDLLFDSYKKEKLFSNFYIAAFLVSLGSLLYINAVYFMLMIWIGLAILRPFNWREWFVTFIGFATPCLITLALFYLNDRLPELINSTKASLLTPVAPFKLMFSHYVFLAYSLLLALISAFFFYTGSNAKKISTRKYFMTFFWMLFFSPALYILIKTVSIEAIFILAIPLSYFYANYFMELRSKWIGEVLFIVFLGIVIYLQI